MNEVAQLSKKLKKDFLLKIQDSKKPVTYWSEKDVLNNKIVNTFVIILRTRGCSWAQKSGCSMCGYFNDSMWKNVTDTDLIKQFDYAMANYNQEKFVKIFTSGSFLDEKEISLKVRKEILNKLEKTTSKVSVESRPEYIKEKTLEEIKSFFSKNFEIGIGLETADDYIRKNYLNKGFTFKDFKNAANKLKKHDIELKTYVLIKPPFMTERASIADAINTVEKIKTITNTISFNPTNVQNNTVVNYLWKRNQYRPPWLFSIVEILKKSKKIVKNNTRIKCDITGGGSVRGAHNCESCDCKFLNAISEFSLLQEAEVFNDLECNCKEKWLDQLDIEDLGFGSLANMYG